MPVGTLVLPDPSDVRSGEGYGEDGTEIYGTLVVPTPFVPNTGDARIIQVCDAVVDLLANTITDATPTRLYAASDKFPEMSDRRLWVFPAAYTDAERLARDELNREYRVAIDVSERYEEPASPDLEGAVPKEWVDERVAWVANSLFALLNTRGVRRRSERLLGTLYPHSCEVEAVYDPLDIDAKVFRSRLVIGYREAVEG